MADKLLYHLFPMSSFPAQSCIVLIVAFKLYNFTSLRFFPPQFLAPSSFVNAFWVSRLSVAAFN